MSSEDVLGDVQFLTGSRHRGDILAALAASPARPTDLSDRVDATRTTVQRVLSGLLERDWAVKRDGQYHLTVTGRRVHEQYRALCEEVERAETVGPLVRALGEVAEDLPAAAIEDGDVVLADDSDPLAPVDAIAEWVADAEDERVRVVTPVVTRTFNRAGASMLDRGTTVEMVIDGGVLERSANAFPDALRRAVEDGAIAVSVVLEPLEWGLTLRESSVTVAAYDDANNVRGIVQSADEAVYEWARERYEQLRERARPLGEVVPESP